MATDALIAADGELADALPETLAGLNENLPAAWSHGNPVDVLGDANSRRIEKAAQIVLADPGVDAVLVILTPQAMTNPTATAKVLGGWPERPSSRPGRLAGRGRHEEGVGILIDAGVPAYARRNRRSARS